MWLGWWEFVWLQCWRTGRWVYQGLSRSGWYICRSSKHGIIIFVRLSAIAPITSCWQWDQIFNMRMPTLGTRTLTSWCTMSIRYGKIINRICILWFLQNGSVNMFYSTPTRYLDALNKAGLTWTLKTDDFFPYADCPWCFYTGFLTSRVNLKGYVRYLNGHLQVCRWRIIIIYFKLTI